MKNILTKVIKKHSLILVMEIILISINIWLLTMPSSILGEIVDLLYNIDLNKNLILKETYYLLLACIAILSARVMWRVLDAKFSRNLVKELRDRIFEKLLKIDVAELQKKKNGDIMSYFVKDIAQIRKFVSNAITTTVRFFLNFIIVAIAMVKSTNIKLTLIALLPIFISMILILLKLKKLGKNYEDSRTKFTSLSEFVQESTDSIRTTKAYVGEQKQFEEFLNKSKSLKDTNFQVIRNETMMSVYNNVGIGVGIGLAILFGSKMVINNEISVGDFVAFSGYMTILSAPIRWMPWIIKHFKKVQVSYKRLEEMFNMKEEQIEIDGNYEKLNGDLEIKNLNYKYPDGNENVLEDININVKPGQSLGIIGVIGSGKTTLMNLLLKLYEVPNGKIFIDGKDLNTIKTDTIRNNICYITQDNFLFSTTLKQNINLFRNIYDDKEIIDSTKHSMIYDEIEEMDDGIETVIGEKGIDLSGGQKQRVVISRAFLSSSNIVIFDDTFSALDNKTEQSVLKNIRELTKKKTCIIISNRISDIKHCDEIVVLEHGKIVERGKHSDLIQKGEKYYEFYRNQAEKSNVCLLD